MSVPAQMIVAQPAVFQYRAAVRSEPMRHRVLAWALMVPFIFFAVHGNFSFLAGSSRGFIGNVVLPGFAYSVVLWLLIANINRVLALALQNKLVAFLGALTVISVVWSQAPMQSATNGIFYLLDTLFAFYLVSKFDTEELMSLFLLCGSIIGGMGLLAVVLLPQYGISHFARTDGAWQGIFVDRTTSAANAVFLISPAILLGRKGFNLRRALYLLVMLAFIFRAKAATAVIVFGVFLIVFVSVRLVNRFARKHLAAVLVIGFPVAVALIYFAPYLLAILFGSFGRDLTLTGRTEIWQTLFRSVDKRPLLGYGYYAFWRGLAGESANVIISARWYFGYAHNGLLEVVLQLGYFGAGLLLATFAQALRNAWTCFRGGFSHGTEWYAYILLLTILYNIDEGTVVWPNQLLSILYVMACCGLAKAARQIRQSRHLEIL